MAKELDEPIFLVGATRSGTTLLTLMLDHHPEIAFPGEFEWPFDFMPESSSPPLEAYHDWLSTNRHFRWHDLEVDRSLGFPDLVRSFLTQMKTGVGPHKPRVGASAHRHYARLHEIWPEARFIHLVRDGRDVAASWIRLGWQGNTYRCAQSWKGSLREWDAIAPQITPERRLELRFEDLIAHPEGKLREVCDFVGVDYHPAMLEYHRDTTYGPLDAGQAGKWRKRLNGWQVRVFESVAGDDLLRYGYEPTGLPHLEVGPTLHLGLDLEARLRQNRARIETFGIKLWLADHVARRLHLRDLHKRVQLEMHEITNASLQ